MCILFVGVSVCLHIVKPVEISTLAETHLRFCLPLVLSVPGMALCLLLGQSAQLGLEIGVGELTTPLASSASGVATDHSAVPISRENI